MADVISELPTHPFLIVGGGILGAGVAALAARAGNPPAVLRRHDEVRPRADTLRNQSWLQSGLLYKNGDFESPEHRIRVANATYSAGRAMLRAFGLSDNERRGVLRVSNEDALNRLHEKVSELDLRADLVREISLEDAQSLLGELHDEDSRYFTLPDTPFDEARVLARMRERAVQAGARFVEVEKPVELEPASDACSGLLVKIGDESIEPSVLLLAAGAGNPRLVERLGLNLGMTFRQTPLLVAHGESELKAPILVDFDNGFSVVRQEPAVVKPNGALIIGTSEHRANAGFELPEDRRIKEHEISAFRKHLPETLQKVISSGRFTAGFEVIPDPVHEQSYLEPWCRADFQEFPGLVIASPGRATLGWQSSTEVYREVLGKISELDKQGEFTLPVTEWDDEIRMHFDSTYEFNDAVL